MAPHAVEGDNAISTAHVSAKDRSSITSAAAVDLKNDTTVPAVGKDQWFHWHEPGTSKEEKKLIFKLDWFLLSFACLLFFIKQVCFALSPVMRNLC